MKRIVKVILIFACLCGVSYFSFHKNPQAALQASDLALENMEALADDEDTIYSHCVGTGSIDCNEIKADWKIIGYGL
jgi:hypothetical protein